MLDGELRIDFRDDSVLLRQGELYVVPKGVEHKPYGEHEVKLMLPYGEHEVKLMLIEPRGVLKYRRHTRSADGTE